LFERADILTIHLVLSSRTHGLVGQRNWRDEVNGPVDQCVARADRRRASFDRRVEEQQIAGAAIDVFDIEPLPPSHAFRTLDNLLATPHLGYVSHGLYKTFYEDTVSNIRKWIDNH